MLLIINVRAGYCGGIAGLGCPMLAGGWRGGWSCPASEAGKAGAERRTRPALLRRKRGRL